MNKPEPITLHVSTSTHGEFDIVLSDKSQVGVVQGQSCVSGGALVKGKSARMNVALASRPEMAAQVAQWLADWQAWEEAKAAAFAANVPGYAELQAALDAAQNEQHRYHSAFDRMMDDENNDGANPPKAENKSFAKRARELAAQYPRAATYIKAQGYLLSDNTHKYAAGRKASELVAAGGDLAEAESILENWLPASAWNN